ncbi:MAG: hypothetical protein Kow0074_10490 [Candidatus Zixiibacteriota bacterium]
MRQRTSHPIAPGGHARIAAVLTAFVLVGAVPVCNAHAFNVDSCHWAQWDTVLSYAKQRPAARFGVYAYRTIAVPHPEVYLQSDSLFLDIIGRIPGSRSTWRGANVRDVEVFYRVQNGEARGPSFSIRDWAPILDSIGDDGMTQNSRSWLNRRLPSAAVLLHGPVVRLSTAEAAMLRYSQYRAFGTPADSAFVVIDTAGQGYVVKQSEVLSVKTNKSVEDAAAIVPALIFNERAVYYPLFDRDDRASSPALQRVSELFAGAKAPEVDTADQRRITQLKDILTLNSRREAQLAALIALGAVDVSLPPVADAWRAVIPDSQSFGTIANGMVRTSVYWADRLSPRTADFAALAQGDSIAAFADTLESAYLKACGRPVDPADSTNTEREAGGFIWSFEMFDSAIDDLIRLRTGSPASQALAMSAILDCRGIENTLVEFDIRAKAKPDQNWVIAERGHWQFNLGQWRTIPKMIGITRRKPLALKSYMIRSEWAGIEATRIYSESDVLTTISDLSRIEPSLPTIFLRVPSVDERVRPLDRLMMDLTNDAIDITPLPWPEYRAGT